MPVRDESLIGDHLMRVRIRKKLFARLAEVAYTESIRYNDHVTVSDLVRSAVHNYLLAHNTVYQLAEILPYCDDDDDDDEDSYTYESELDDYDYSAEDENVLFVFDDDPVEITYQAAIR